MWDRYQDEADCAAKLAAWDQWRRGDGVKGQVSAITWCEDERLLKRELNRDNFRLPLVVSDAEHTNRALQMLRNSDAKGCAALLCYHLENSSMRRVAKAAKLRTHMEAEAVLRRAHESFWYCRAQTVNAGARSENPAPVLAFQPATALNAAPVLGFLDCDTSPHPLVR